jgi:DNA-binding Lrp family transcriptional regulator
MRPWLAFFPGDWQRDAALRACSVAARGLWIEMLCIMHQAEPYGHLVVNGQAIPSRTLARMVGASVREVDRWLGELEVAGVFDREGEAIVSRRMVRDERVRKARADGGKLGGNPALKVISKDAEKVGNKVNLPLNLRPTPSESESESESEVNLPLADARGVASEAGPPAPAAIPAKPKIPDCPHEAIVTAYHELLPACPRVREWNTARQGYLRSRWREKAKPNGSGQGYATAESGIAWWREFFSYVAKSQFLTGRAAGQRDRPPFVADLEWLVRPGNFAKVIEGKYHDAAA